MKKIFFILALTLFTITANSQNTYRENALEKCYINKNTGDTVMSTYWRNLFTDPNLLVNYRLKKINSTTFLEVKFHIGPYGIFTVSDTNSLWINTMENETIELKSDRNVTATTGGARILMAGATVKGVHAFYPIPRKYCIALQSDLIREMSIFCSSGRFDVKINKGASLLANDFRLISQKPRKIKRKSPQ